MAAQRNIHAICYGFNQDYSCFVCGTTAGFRVFTASPVREIRRCERPVGDAGATAAADAAGGADGSGHGLEQRAVGVISMLFQTNVYLLATIPDDSVGGLAALPDGNTGYARGPKQIQIWDDSAQKVLHKIRSRHEVRGIAVRRDVIAVVCEHVVYVYDGDTLRPLLILDTAANPHGLCVLAAASMPWMLCCPGKAAGEVRIQVGTDDHGSRVLDAHQTELACIAVNSSGTLVATASVHGTVVKIWRASDGQLLCRLRRGSRRAAVTSLAFREDDRFLAVASLSSTVHVFQLATDFFEEMWSKAGGSSASGAASPVAGGALRQDTIGVIRKESAESELGFAEVVNSRFVPNYFNDQKSCAQFRIPDMEGSTGGVSATLVGYAGASVAQAAVDVRASCSSIQGPKVGFRGQDPLLLVLHYSGVLYEVPFHEEADPGAEGGATQECSYAASSLWFAPRPDFRVRGPGAPEPAPELCVGDGEEEAWQLL